MNHRKVKPYVLLASACAAGMVLQACAAPSGAPPTATAPTVAPEVTIFAPTDAAEPEPSPSPTASAMAEPTPAAEAPTQPPAPTSELATAALTLVLLQFADGLEKPTYLTHAGDDSGLLYVTEQPGRIRVLRGGQLVETPFLDITDRVGDSGNEQGLLSVAFAPDFAQSRKLYVNYTNTGGDTVVSGFIASADGLTADLASEWKVIEIAQPYANHNGGQLKFGPDGMLYVGMGDGGSAGDPQNLAQNVSDLLGKMLRLDVSNSSATEPYAVPADNPSFGPDGRPEMWAVGLRNPWRFSFDRSTGDMFIADVGQNAMEEVNFQPAASTGGENYGWKLREGFEAYSGEPLDTLTDPVWQYEHGANGCSVTGGYVYRGAALPSLAGAYVYGDYCSGRIWTLRPGSDGSWVNQELFATDYGITSFGEDADGELYVLDRGGAIYKIVGG